MRTRIGFAALAAGVLLAGAAHAAPGFATADVNLRAGPSTQYPALTVVPEGGAVNIRGCLRDRSWCDVSYAGTRGWVSNNYLELLRGRARAPLTVWSGPIVTFDVGRYWGSYYRDRPFYRDRDRWTRFNRDYGWERPGWRGGGGPQWRDGDRDRPNWRDRDRDDRWRDGRRQRDNDNVTGERRQRGSGGGGPGTVPGYEVTPPPGSNPLFPRLPQPPN